MGANNGGWIKLYRSMLDWEWYGDINTKVLFLHLLLTASYEDNIYLGIEVKRGQRLCSIRKLAEETGLSVRNIRTALSNLKRSKQVTQYSTQYPTQYPTQLKNPKGTVLTILNYEKYQEPTQYPTQYPTQQVTHTKEYKNIKKEKSILTYTLKERKTFDEFWALYPKKRSKGAALKVWERLKPDDVLLKTILEKLEIAKGSKEWQKESGQFIPYPATWLNAQGWEDEFGGVVKYEKGSDSL